MLTFDTIMFQIQATSKGNHICYCVIDGACTSIMSLACPQALRSLKLVSSTTFLKSFENHSLKTNGIIPAFPIKLVRKTMLVQVKVVDTPLDYNMLLGRNWSYAMQSIISLVFKAIWFPHESKIVTIN